MPECYHNTRVLGSSYSVQFYENSQWYTLVIFETQSQAGDWLDAHKKDYSRLRIVEYMESVTWDTDIDTEIPFG